MRDRTYYATLPTERLDSLYQDIESRSQRADTAASYLADAFALDEITAVLIERGAPIPDSPEPIRIRGNC